MPFFSEKLNRGIPERVAVLWDSASTRLSVRAELWSDETAAENVRRLVMSPLSQSAVPFSNKPEIRRTASNALNTLRSTIHGFLRQHYKLQTIDNPKPHKVKAFVKAQFEQDAFLYKEPKACSETAVPCYRMLTRFRHNEGSFSQKSFQLSCTTVSWPETLASAERMTRKLS